MSGLRIIAGRFRGRSIEAPSGDTTRPVLSRVRQSLFDIIAPLLPGARVLDCFAGSGVFGLEALSRGADSVVAVDRDRLACVTIARNAEKLGVETRVKLHHGEIQAVLPRLSDTFDIIFVAPPYHHGLAVPVTAQLADSALLGPETLVICQYDRDEAPDESIYSPRWTVSNRREYGRTIFHFLEP